MTAFLYIATLLNSNIPHDELISVLYKVESSSLEQYKINDIPSIEVNDKNKLKKKQMKNITLILKNYLDMVIVIKEKEAWSIKVIDANH